MNCPSFPVSSSKDCFRDGAEVASMVDVCFWMSPSLSKAGEERRQMTKSTIRVAIDVGSKSHWVGVGISVWVRVILDKYL